MMKIVRNSVCYGLVWILVSTLFSNNSLAQGKNSNWLMGYQSKMRMTFTDTSYAITSETRKIPFWETQGNISDEYGNLLMSSNGYFIANVTGDTMQNGSGINPGLFTDDYGATYGLPLTYANVILPLPGDTSKYVLFHQTGNYNSPTLASLEIYYSLIDMNLNGGLGGVISKNNIAITGSFGWGLSACRHGNGRDWWIIALSDSGRIAHKIVLNPDTVEYIGSQNLQVPAYVAWGGQPTFSPDGNQFAFSHTKNLGNGQYPLDVRLFDFDRCSGNFTNKMFEALGDSTGGFGISFSPNSRFLYIGSTQNIYQFDTDAPNIALSKLTVAVNDTFLSAPPVFYTNFYLMYLAANGKIYISSSSSVLHLHEVVYPDSIGTSCDIQLHNIYTTHFYIGVPNHPNYYLGTLAGSPCDTLTSISEIEHDIKFKIFPNPSNGVFKILYLLPQNEKGKLEVFDVNGRRVFEMNLPPWSTMQEVTLPSWISSGVYNCVISSGDKRVNTKIVVFNE